MPCFSAVPVTSRAPVSVSMSLPQPALLDVFRGSSACPLAVNLDSAMITDREQNRCELIMFLFCFVLFWSWDQAALGMVLSVCLSHLFHYVPIIVSWNVQELLPMTKSHHCMMKCSGVITNDKIPSLYHEMFRSYYQWQKWCPCKRSRSKVKVTEVKILISHFR